MFVIIPAIVFIAVIVFLCSAKSPESGTMHNDGAFDRYSR